jgi:hypothetical protein
MNVLLPSALLGERRRQFTGEMLDAYYKVRHSHCARRFDLRKTYPFLCELLDIFFVARYDLIQLLG